MNVQQMGRVPKVTQVPKFTQAVNRREAGTEKPSNAWFPPHQGIKGPSLPPENILSCKRDVTLHRAKCKRPVTPQWALVQVCKHNHPSATYTQRIFQSTLNLTVFRTHGP